MLLLSFTRDELYSEGVQGFNFHSQLDTTPSFLSNTWGYQFSSRLAGIARVQKWKNTRGISTVQLASAKD